MSNNRDRIINLTDQRAKDNDRLAAWRKAAEVLGVDPHREDAHDKNDR